MPRGGGGDQRHSRSWSILFECDQCRGRVPQFPLPPEELVMMPHFLTTAVLALAILGLGVPSAFAIKCKTVATDKFYTCPDLVSGVKVTDCLQVKEADDSGDFKSCLKWEYKTESSMDGDVDLVTSEKTYPVTFLGFDGGGSDKACGDVQVDDNYFAAQFKASKMPDGITLVVDNDFRIFIYDSVCCDKENCNTGLGFAIGSTDTTLSELGATSVAMNLMMVLTMAAMTLFVTSA
eukprot:gene1195-32535_t